MNAAIHAAESAFQLVTQTTWQATVVAGLILLTQWIFRKRLSPGWRYGLWMLLVVKLLMPVSVQSALSIFNLAKFESQTLGWDLSRHFSPPPDFSAPTASALTAQQVALATTNREPEPPGAMERIGQPELIETLAHRTPRHDTDWLAIPALGWLCGVCVFGLRLLWSSLRFSSRLAKHLPVENEKISRVFNGCASAHGIRGRVSLIETAEVDSPAVYGLWHKRVLLPEGFSERFSTDELRYIFLHELAHIKRRDLEINWLVSASQVLHWFNPFLWFAFARIRADRELACDALALVRIGENSSLSYGETIIKLLESLARPAAVPGLLGISEDKNRLKQRIRMIATFKRPTRWSAAALLLVGGLGLIGLTDASKGRPATSAAGVDLQQKSAPVETNSRSGTGVRGVVLDPDGKPVAGATVKCQGFAWQATTDAQGRFQWKGLDQTYAFTVEQFGFGFHLTPPLAPGTNENVIKLEHVPVIGGRVIDRDTREPIAQFEVYHARLVMNRIKPGIMSHDPIMGRAGEFKYSFSPALWLDDALYVYGEGHAPQLSRPLTPKDDGTELTFELVKASPIAGKVLTAEGKPAANAEVRLWSGQLNFQEITSHDRTNTDNAGIFSLPPALGGEITVNHDSGFARVSWERFQSDHMIKLAQWGHIKGHWPKPWPESRRVWLQPVNWTDAFFTSQPSWVNTPAKLNSDGEFSFEDPVPPGEYRLGETVDLEMHWRGGGTSRMMLASERVHFVVGAGQTAIVEVPDGRAVVGRVDFGEDLTLTNVALPIVELRSKLAAPDFKYPAPEPSLSASANLKRLQDYREELLSYWLSDEGKAIRRAERRFKTHADPYGNFEFDHVPPGDYVLLVDAQYAGAGASRAKSHRSEISIPSSTAGTPVEVGVVKLAANETPASTPSSESANLRGFRLISAGEAVAEVRLLHPGDLRRVETVGPGGTADYDLGSGTVVATNGVLLVIGPVSIQAEAIVYFPDDQAPPGQKVELLPQKAEMTPPVPLRTTPDSKVQDQTLSFGQMTLNYPAELLATNQVRIEFGANGVWRTAMTIMHPCELAIRASADKVQAVTISDLGNRITILSGGVKVEGNSDGHRSFEVTSDEVRIIE